VASINWPSAICDRRLYQRLGYQARGHQHASREYEDDNGVLRL